MSTPKIFESEYRFCLILWEHEPLPSAELAKLCKERLGWSRTTTYTVIHRLGERGIVKNENGLVSSLVSKDEAQPVDLVLRKLRLARERRDKRGERTLKRLLDQLVQLCRLRLVLGDEGGDEAVFVFYDAALA